MNLTGRPSSKSASVSEKKSPRLVAPAECTRISIRPNALQRLPAQPLSPRCGCRSQATRDGPPAELLDGAAHLGERRAVACHQRHVGALARQFLGACRPMPRLAPLTIAILPSSPRFMHAARSLVADPQIDSQPPSMAIGLPVISLAASLHRKDDQLPSTFSPVTKRPDGCLVFRNSCAATSQSKLIARHALAHLPLGVRGRGSSPAPVHCR